MNFEAFIRELNGKVCWIFVRGLLQPNIDEDHVGFIGKIECFDDYLKLETSPGELPFGIRYEDITVIVELKPLEESESKYDWNFDDLLGEN